MIKTQVNKEIFQEKLNLYGYEADFETSDDKIIFADIEGETTVISWDLALKIYTALNSMVQELEAEENDSEK